MSQFFLLLVLGCTMPEWLENWKQAEMEKRYGTKKPAASSIPEWQADLAEYDDVLNEKLEAGEKTARLHRKIGEAFAYIESFQLCREHLEQALILGEKDPEVHYWHGVCSANLARKFNWKSQYLSEAEQSFLSALRENERFDKAKLQLGLLYFYGFGTNSKYSILGKRVTIDQEQFRDKAIQLLKEYQNYQPEDSRSYFALAAAFSSKGEKNAARMEMQGLLDMLSDLYPDSYQDRDEYQKAWTNLQQLK